MEDRDKKLRKDIITRLRRIEGQIKGIQGMVDKNVCCKDVLIQISAVRAATNKVGSMLIENYARNCLGIDYDSEVSEGLEEIIKTINTFIK